MSTLSDGKAAAQIEEGDGYAAALMNFRFLANAVWTTQENQPAMQAT